MKKIDLTSTFTKDELKYNIYWEEKMYVSVFSEKQNQILKDAIKGPIDFLIELCLSVPHQIKKIVYLAEEILELSKRIPSALNPNHHIDMSSEACNDLKEIANYASQVQVGLAVNIDRPLKSIQAYYG